MQMVRRGTCDRIKLCRIARRESIAGIRQRTRFPGRTRLADFRAVVATDAARHEQSVARALLGCHFFGWRIEHDFSGGEGERGGIALMIWPAVFCRVITGIGCLGDHEFTAHEICDSGNFSRLQDAFKSSHRCASPPALDGIEHAGAAQFFGRGRGKVARARRQITAGQCLRITGIAMTEIAAKIVNAAPQFMIVGGCSRAGDGRDVRRVVGGNGRVGTGHQQHQQRRKKRDSHYLEVFDGLAFSARG